MPFENNCLYISLFGRLEAHQPHWGLYYHGTSESGGVKYHIKQLGDGWITDHATTHGAEKSNYLLGFIRIARFRNSESFALADQIIQGFPYNVPNMTCRIWVMEAIRRLVANGLVLCPNLDGLQAECFKFGADEYNNMMAASRPRPIVDSLMCII